MGYWLLALSDLIVVLAIVAILGRLFAEYEDGSLTSKTLLVGGFLLAGLSGLLVAGIQMLLQGPGL